MIRARRCVGALLLLTLGMWLSACSSAHYKRSADKEVYGIITDTETNTLGRVTGFNIDTPYSKRDPREIKAGEIIADRIQSEKKFLTIGEALRLAVAQSRTYQFRKETLYLSALTLTKERYEFSPQFFGTSTATVLRNDDGSSEGSVRSRVGVGQFLKTGARLGASLANDIFRYYAGDPSRTVSSIISVNLLQPLLRGAGAEVAAENLTQAERNVVYEVRGFSRFQNTFAVDIVIAYFRLLQQKDTVRNEYNTYKNLVLSRERSQALARDRLPQYQVDQAQQDELRARNRYILAIERYQDGLDAFKTALGLPLGVELQLDDHAMDELNAFGLAPVELEEKHGYELAVQKRLDLLNDIDRFEDTKRKIQVAASFLKADLNLFASASLGSRGLTDYTRFNFDDYKGAVGLQLNLPLDRLVERNNYRATFVSFERQLRALSLALDEVRDNVRQGLRSLELARQSYDIQRVSVELANRRVESANLLIQAGRAQIRDLLEAQSAQLQALIAFTTALVDYHVARLGLLRDLGLLNTDEEAFWLKPQSLPKRGESPAPAGPAIPVDEVITPDQLFGTK